MKVLFSNLNQEQREPTQSTHPLMRTLQDLQNVTKIFAAVAIVVFVISQIMIRVYQIDEVNTIILLGGQFRVFIIGGYEYWRFITAIFLHTDFIHLLSNLFSLIIVGNIIEKMYSKKQYIGLFLLSGIVGGMFSFLFGKSLLSLGMSGSLFGLLGAYTIFLFETNAIRYPPVRNQLLLILGLNVFISLSVPSIDAFAHLGGFLTGLLFALALNRRPSWFSMRKQSVIALILLVGVMSVWVLSVRTIPEIYWGTVKQVFDVMEQWGLKGYVNWLRTQLLGF